MIDKIKSIFSLSTLALFTAVGVFYLIITTLHQGISCDEGFYLMGYQRGQALGDFISDYANIVRAITPQGMEENIMIFRYERLVLLLLILSLFGFSLYHWLRARYDFSISKVLFYSLVFLAGGLSYTFASPTISYDSIQTFVYLLAFSGLFLAVTSKSKFSIGTFLLLSGAVSLVGILNYFPSGVFLVLILFVWIYIEFPEKQLKKILLFIFGMLIGAVFYHFLVRNLVEYAVVAFETIVRTFTEKSASGHDSSGLIKSFAIKTGIFSLFFPVIFVLSLLFKKIRLPKIVFFGLLAVISLFLLVYRKYYGFYAPVFFVPTAILMGGWLAEKKFSSILKVENRDVLLLISLIFLPFLAVFGTNQNLFAKMLIFMPFWLILFFIVFSQIENSKIKRSATFLLIITMFAGYVYLGNFSRYHYYYTPRSSKFPLENIVRTQSITVSKFQQEYYREVADTLKYHGAQNGDKYVAFGENQMTVFLMGGSVVGKLPYHWFQYKDFETGEQPSFFILFKNEEMDVIEMMKKTEWQFPENYSRIELRPMSENMDQEELRTVIYALKSAKHGVPKSREKIEDGSPEVSGEAQSTEYELKTWNLKL